MSAILLILGAYLLGSAPFGLLVALRLCGVDPRLGGSGNVGATNVARLCGVGYGILTLALDMLKGLVPVLAAMHYDGSVIVVSLTALAALTGHCYSVFLKFNGGKAVATTIGVFLPLAAWQLLVCLALAAAIAWATGFMSLGSLLLALSLPVLLLLSGKAAWAPLAAAVMLLVFWRHRMNIQRLVRGEENSWRKNKSPDS